MRLPEGTNWADPAPEPADEVEWLARNLAKARRERDEARLWAWGCEHGKFPFRTDERPLWLTVFALPADPSVVGGS